MAHGATIPVKSNLSKSTTPRRLGLFLRLLNLYQLAMDSLWLDIGVNFLILGGIKGV